MVRILKLLTGLSPLWSGLLCSAEGADSLWIYEGPVTRVDPVLASDFEIGWVLSGSFQLDPIEMGDDPSFRESRSGRLTGGIREGELTIDHYHQLQFEALQATPLAGFDYMNNDPAEGDRDLVGWFFPMEGTCGEDGWTSTWLQIWLADPEGSMITEVPPSILPRGLAWESGWFRLSFVNESGERAFIEGSLEVFGPAGEAVPGNEAEVWAAVAGDLADRLRQRDRTIDGLRDDLGRARERLDGMQRMIDLLVEERAHLEDDNERLNASLRDADPESAERVAELEAEKALLAEDLSLLKEEKADLETRLRRSAMERRKLREKLEATADQAETPSGAASTEVELSGFHGSGRMTLFEAPMIIERVVPLPVGGSMEPITLELERDPPAPRRRPGPRKFR